MKKLLLLIIGSLAAVASLEAQAPLGPAMETDLSRIDSLTMLLYQKVPSHIAMADTASLYNLDMGAFTSQMAMLGSSISFPYNDQVNLHIRYLMAQNESFYEMIHKRMQLYFPLYEQVLDKYNLPQELKYVSIIESHLNPNAVSWCGATGLWQFMPYTGRSMGMRIDYSMDERKSIIRSTEKACEYFRNSYNQFGDWLLAIASYNCGAGNVQRAINMAGGSKDFWKIRYYLPKETQNYVPKFIAAAYVLNFTKNSNYKQINERSSVLVPTPVDSTMSMSHLAKFLGVAEDEIISINREYLNKKTPESQKYQILLPYELSMKFVANKDSAYAFARREKAVEDANKPVYVKKYVPTYHYVSRGQTLYSIARRHGVTVYQLKAWNGLKSNYAPVGRNLVVYKMQWVANKQG
jgi:membrane-bound lytic murein transglycosylase D